MMLGTINHIAIAVPNLAQASEQWGARTGAIVSPPQTLPEHGVRVVFVDVPGNRIELLEPLDEHSPIAKFLERNPDGGMHHICFEVEDLLAMRDQMIAEGARVLGDGEPRIGAHGNPVLFFHPKDFSGTLVELEQVS